MREPLMPHEATALELCSFGTFGQTRTSYRRLGGLASSTEAFQDGTRSMVGRPGGLMPAEQEEPDPWFQARSQFPIPGSP